MQPDAYLRRLTLFVASRPAHAVLLLSRDEHDELLNLAAQVLARASSHLLRQELVQTVLGWFDDLSHTYGFITTDFRQLLNQCKNTIHVEARARYALVSLFHCIIHDEARTRHLQVRAPETDSDSFSKLCEFLRTSLNEEEQVYWDSIVLFLCDTLAWVCNINIVDDDADIAWIYSPDSCSEIIITDNMLDPMFADSMTTSTASFLYFEQYPKLYNIVTYISRSVRGLYYHALNALSSLRRAEHLMQLSNISCRLLQTLSAVVVDEYLSDNSNTVTFAMHSFTQSNHNMSKSRKLFKQHEMLIMKLLGFTTALGNVYAQALASYYFIHAELYMIDASDEDMSLLEELINDLSEDVAVTIVRFSRAFLVEDEVQNSSDDIITWLMNTDFQGADGKQRLLTLTREYDLLRYDAFFYIMVAFISSIRSVCNYFTKEFGLQVYSFHNFIEANASLSCVSEFLLSRFAIRRHALEFIAIPQMNFYDCFLDAYELRNDDEMDVVLTEFKPPIHYLLENLAIEPLQLRILRFVLTSPYFNESYCNTSEAIATKLSACMSFITPEYLAKSLSCPSSILLIGNFFAQTFGTYTTSLYLARFILEAKVLDNNSNSSINIIKAWICIFRGLKLAQEYIINIHPLAFFELTDMDSSQPFCVHESMALYNTIFPSFVSIRAPETSLSRQIDKMLIPIFSELLYFLGLASPVQIPDNISTRKVTTTQQTLISASTLIQEIYVLVSIIQNDNSNTWACSAIIDGLLYTIEMFVSFNKQYLHLCSYSYTDHCLLLDIILKYGPPEHVSSMLNRFSTLPAGSVTIADFISNLMSGHRGTTSLISNHILSFRYSVVNLTSITNVINIDTRAQLLQNRHDLLQVAYTDELPNDLADILYEMLIDDIIGNATYMERLFDRRQSPHRLMCLPFFQHFPPEIVADFLSDFLYLIAEDSHYSTDERNLIQYTVDVENPFNSQRDSPPVPLRHLLFAFITSMEQRDSSIDLDLFSSLNPFRTQSQGEEMIVLGGTPCHLEHVLHGVLTLTGICAYLNNVTASLPSFTDILRHISLFIESSTLGYSGISLFTDLHSLTKLTTKTCDKDSSTFSNSSRLIDRWSQNTIDIIAHHPVLIDRLVSIRSAIMFVGRQLARQGSSLLIKLEVMLNIGTSGDFFQKYILCPPEINNENNQKDYQTDESNINIQDMSIMRLFACFTRMTRTDFYEFNKNEKLHLLQYAKARNDFLPHYQQITMMSDAILEDDEYCLWAKNSIENVMSVGATIFSNIPLADQTCCASLIAFISGKHRDNTNGFMFSSLLNLYMAILALYGSCMTQLHYPEEKGSEIVPQRSIFLRIIYLLGNFLHITFNLTLQKTSKVFPNTIDNSESLLHSSSFRIASIDNSEDIYSLTDWEDVIASTALIILLHILKKTVNNADNNTINIIEWTISASSESPEFFTLTLSVLYTLLKYTNQCYQSSTLILSSDQSDRSYNCIKVISIQSQIQSVLHATIEAMLFNLTRPISGYVMGLRLPQYSLFINRLEADKITLYRDYSDFVNQMSNKTASHEDSSLTKIILREIYRNDCAPIEKMACIKENMSNLVALSRRHNSERISTKFPKKFHLSSIKALPPHSTDEQYTPTLSFFNVHDLLTIHASKPINSALLMDLIKTPTFGFPSSDITFWGAILCNKNCGHEFLKILLKAFLNSDQSLMQLPLPLLYLSRLSPDLETIILAEGCLSKRCGPKGWHIIDAYLMNLYLAEANNFLLSLPRIKPNSIYTDQDIDPDFILWIYNSFLQVTNALFHTLQLQNDCRTPSGISFAIFQTLLKHINPYKWKEHALKFVEQSGLDVDFRIYTLDDPAISNEQVISGLFEHMAIGAIKSLSQNSSNISVILCKNLQAQLPKEARESLCYLALLYSPEEYMQYIVSEWTNDPEWCASLIIYLGSPLHDLQRSLFVEVIFIKLFDFERIFKPWLNCPSVEHLLEFFSQTEEINLTPDIKNTIDSIDKIDIKYVPKALITRIVEYQKNKYLFGLTTIITIVLSLCLSENNAEDKLCGFQSSALSLFAAASDFFYLDELVSREPMENYSSLSGYLSYASLDITAIINKIATASEYNSFVKLPNLHNQILYYNLSPVHSISHTKVPSLLQFLTTQTEIVTIHKRLKRSVTSISPKSIFISAFVSFLEKMQHIFSVNSSNMVTISNIVSLSIKFYYDILLHKRISSDSALTMEMVIKGIVDASMSNPVNRSDISSTTTKVLVDILAIKACDYSLSGGNQYQFKPITQILTDILNKWDAILLSPKTLGALLTDLYSLSCLYSIPNLSQQIGLLIFKILRLLKSMDTGTYQIQAALAGASLISIGNTDAAIDILQSHGFLDLHNKDQIKDCILKYIVSSPIEQVVITLLNNSS